MRYVPRPRLRRVALSLVAVVALAAASFATLSFTSGDVAQATDDWTSGHTSDDRTCVVNERFASAYTPYPWSGYGYGVTWICWNGTAYVNVQGHAKDYNAPYGYCAVDRIRYRIYINGGWSGYHYRNMATACDGNDKTSTWWWNNYDTTGVVMQACLRDGSTGPIVSGSCSNWV
jgi:hypothetical protein